MVPMPFPEISLKDVVAHLLGYAAFYSVCINIGEAKDFKKRNSRLS
jgi:hypothetical protein